MVLEKLTFKDYTVLYTYIAQGQRQINQRGYFIATKKFYNFNQTLEISPLTVLNSLIHFEKMSFQHFVWGRKFYLAVKRSKVILGSSSEQIGKP